MAMGFVRAAEKRPSVEPSDLLDLVVTPPAPGVLAAAFTTYPVSYEHETDTRFDTVTRLPDAWTIEVRVVSLESLSPNLVSRRRKCASERDRDDQP